MTPILASQMVLPLGSAVADPFLGIVQKKRVPSVDYILKVCGPNTESRSKTIESACHGFEEITAMKELYPFMNVTESVHLASAVFNAKNTPHLVGVLATYELNNILKSLCVDALVDSVVVPDKLHAEHIAMNPHSRGEKNSLVKRLARAPPEHVGKLALNVNQPARKYVFPPHFGTTHDTITMHYQMNSPRYDRRGVMLKDDGRIVNKKFAQHIVRMISKY